MSTPSNPDANVAPPPKKPRLASSRPMTSSERNQKSLEKLRSQVEEAQRYLANNLPVPPHLQAAVDRDNSRKAKKAELRRKDKVKKATLSPPSQLSAGPSHQPDTAPCPPSENTLEKEMNELKLQLTAAKQQTTIYREDHEKNMDELKAQLTAANQLATIYREDHEKAMDRLKSQQQAQLAAANQLATAKQRQYEEEIKKLRSNLTIAKQFAPSLQAYKEEARKLKLQLEEANRKVSEVKAIFNHEDIKCSICHEVRWQPASLTCAHSFCATCLEGYFRTRRQQRQDYDCPICRTVTDIATEDTDLKALTEKIAFLLYGTSPSAMDFDFQKLSRFLNSTTIYVNSRR